MRPRQTLPLLWILSDKRNDAALERTLRLLPPGSGLVFRHYHLGPAERRARFRTLTRIARTRGHMVVLAASPAQARAWGADGAYGAPQGLHPAAGMVLLATCHSLRELGAARRAGADAAFLSPVFATRTHPGARSLGPVRFRLLARHSDGPVIALGGLDARSARRLAWESWGAIDGHGQR